jgi:hypothetical protein
MGATITLTGKPHHVRSAGDHRRSVAFEIDAGPANASTPKGMPVFGPTTYHVVCPQRMWDRGHMDGEDRSDVIVEGYLEPRMSEEGKPCVAVVATSLTTKLVEITSKTQQLLADAAKAEKAYNALRSRYGEDAPVVQEARAEMEKLKTGLTRYCEANQKILRPAALLQPEYPQGEAAPQVM